MKIAFTGKTKELEFGINEIAEFLDFSIADGEYAINVIQEKDSDIIISFKDKNGSITFSEKHHFFGGLLSRIDTAIYEISAYLEGKMERIEELEVERQYFNGYSGPLPSIWSYARLATPSKLT